MSCSILSGSTISDPGAILPEEFYYNSEVDGFGNWHSSTNAYCMPKSAVYYARVFEPHPKRLAEERKKLGRKGKNVKIPKVFVARRDSSSSSPAAAFAAAWRAEQDKINPTPLSGLSTPPTRASTSSARSTATTSSKLSFASERFSTASKAVASALRRRT